nr:RHS repeat-associated core domain-containing protein [Bordetella sp. LUAb4]
MITQEEYYPYGGTAVLASRSNSEAKYKYIRYSGKERDATGLYYYGLRYYQPWIGRWVNPDPAGTVDGQNLYCMVRNNPVTSQDRTGMMAGASDPEQGPTGKKSRAAVLRGASFEEPLAPEIWADWEWKGYLKPSDPNAGPGATLDISHRDRPEFQIGHHWDKPICLPGKKVVDKIFHFRRSQFNLTIMRTFDEVPGTEKFSSTQAATYSSGPVFLRDGTRATPSYEELKYAVVPLVRNMGSNRKTNFAEVVRDYYEDPEGVRTSARAALVHLVATRAADEAGFDRGRGGGDSHRGDYHRDYAAIWRWNKAKIRVVDRLQAHIEQAGLDFNAGQEFLYGYLRNAETREELIDKSEPPTRKRKAGPADGSAASKASRRAHPTTQRDASLPGPSLAFARPLSPVEVPRPISSMQAPPAHAMPQQAYTEQFSAPPTPMLPQGPLRANPPAFGMPQWSSMNDFWPSTPMLQQELETLSSPAALATLDPGNTPATQPHAYWGDPFGAGPSHASLSPFNPWQQAMPAQPAQPFGAPIPRQIMAQGQALENLLPDEYDPTLFLNWTGPWQDFSQQPPGQ